MNKMSQIYKVCAPLPDGEPPEPEWIYSIDIDRWLRPVVRTLTRRSEAILFADWIVKNEFRYDEDGYWEEWNEDQEQWIFLIDTTDALYEMWLEDTNPHKELIDRVESPIEITIKKIKGNTVKYDRCNDGLRYPVDKPYTPEWQHAKFRLPSGKAKTESFPIDCTPETILEVIQKKYSNLKFILKDQNK